MSEFDMFLDKFLQNVKKNEDKKIFSFADDKGSIVSSYTYGTLEKATRSLATALLDKGCKKGDPVVLVYPPGLDFIVAFIACLRAGIVAVPVYPPHPQQKKNILQFVEIQTSCKAQWALTNKTYNHAKNFELLMISRKPIHLVTARTHMFICSPISQYLICLPRWQVSSG